MALNWPIKRKQFARKRFWLAIVTIAILLGVANWGRILIRDAQDAARAMSYQCNLNRLWHALHNYHATHGSFPPAYLVDDDGTPVHSWRVLVLPFFEEKALYEEYSFDEPWNGPNNLKLADRMPRIFRMQDGAEQNTMTNIVAITGPGTAFPGLASTRIGDFTDGSDNTILLAEMADSDICWLEPRDLIIAEMSFTVNDQQKPSISCTRRRGPYVVFADSLHTHQLSSALRPETVKALTTIAGGEKMYMGHITGRGLATLGNGQATDDTIEQLDLIDLKSLWLSRSNITDNAIGHLLKIPSLRNLHLRSTSITDEGLRKIKTGSPFTFVDLSLTQVTDDGLQHLSKLRDLHYPGLSLKLHGSHVTTSGVGKFLTSMPKPEFPADVWVYFDQGSVSHEIMFFGGAQLTDTQLQSYKGIASFTQINLSNTRITDAGLEHLKGLKKLRSLDLRNTRVTDVGVTAFQQVLPDCVVRFEKTN